MSDTPNPTPQGRWSAIYEAMTGATAPGHDHDTDVPGANAQSQTAGHEPDAFDARGIIYVPILVTVTAAVAFGIITILFSLLNPGQPKTTPNDNPAAVADSSADYNDRMARINSSETENARVKEPRLEYMRQVDNPRGEPVYARSFRPAKTWANSPEITPQDLYPHKYVDPVTKLKVLLHYSWVSEEKKVARIPIATAMKLVLAKLPTKPLTTPVSTTTDKPKLSNGGQATKATPVEASAKAEPKHDDHAKDDHKKDDHKDEKKK
jgi:hypothetical protein